MKGYDYEHQESIRYFKIKRRAAMGNAILYHVNVLRHLVPYIRISFVDAGDTLSAAHYISLKIKIALTRII